MIEDAKLFLRSRKQLYSAVFGTPEGRAVLRDLAKKAKVLDGGNRIRVDHDNLKHLEGRRWLFSYIANHLGLDVEDLYKLYQEGKDL